MRVHSFATFAPLLLIVAGGCGDPQLSANYRGEPLWTLRGQTTVAGGNFDTSQKIRMALFFSPEGREVIDTDRWVEHLGSAVALQVPSLWDLNVFEPPGPEHMLRNPDGSDAGFAVARLMVYTDLNDDGLHQNGEPFISIAPPIAIYYVRDPLPAATTETVYSLPAGFSQTLVPQPCGYVPPAPTDEGDCGVPLGERCAVDTDCKGGLCLKETKMPWAAGYCIIPDPPPSGCRPAKAAYMARPASSLTPLAAKQGMYLRACQTNGDCRREFDRDQDLYNCDLGLGACRPRLGSVLMPVGGNFQVEPFCPKMP